MARTLNWQNRCQKCGKLKKTTYDRTFYTKKYKGRCGDSFCYASCDMEACKPIRATICDDCFNKLKHPKHTY